MYKSRERKSLRVDPPCPKKKIIGNSKHRRRREEGGKLYARKTLSGEKTFTLQIRDQRDLLIGKMAREEGYNQSGERSEGGGGNRN